MAAATHVSDAAQIEQFTQAHMIIARYYKVVIFHSRALGYCFSPPSAAIVHSPVPPVSMIRGFPGLHRPEAQLYTHMPSKEVFTTGTSTGGYSASMVRHSAENLEVWLQILTQIHDGSDIATSVAVIGRGPDSDNILVFEMVL